MSNILIKVRTVDDNRNKGTFSEMYKIKLIDMNPIAHDYSLNPKLVSTNGRHM